MQEQKETPKENQPPTKEELIEFFQEQISVKKAQLELQELNTKLVVARAEELKALAFIGQMTNPKSAGNEYNGEGIPHTITQEDIDNNPELAEQGVQVGDEVLIPEPAKRSLKKEK